MKSFSDFLCWCAGVPPEIVAKAPEWRNRPATQGAAMLVVATFAAIAGGYAFSRMFAGTWFAGSGALVFGPFWGLLFFVIERIVVLSVVKGLPWYTLFIQAAGRGLVAFMTAWCISTPIVLGVSSSILDAQLRREARTRLDVERNENAARESLADLQKNVADLEKGRARQLETLRRDPDTLEWTHARDAVSEADRAFEATRTANLSRIQSARARSEALRVIPERTPDQDDVIERLRAQIAGWQGEIVRSERNFSDAREHEAAVRTAWIADQQRELVKLETRLGQAQATHDQASGRAAVANDESQVAIDSLYRTNLVNQYAVYSRIVADPKHPQSASMWWWAHILHSLFFLIDSFVLLSKLYWPEDPIDQAAQALARIRVDRNNLDANLLMHRNQALTAAMAEARDAWRDNVRARLQAHPDQALDIIHEIQDEIDKAA